MSLAAELAALGLPLALGSVLSLRHVAEVPCVWGLADLADLEVSRDECGLEDRRQPKQLQALRARTIHANTTVRILWAEDAECVMFVSCRKHVKLSCISSRRGEAAACDKAFPYLSLYQSS